MTDQLWPPVAEWYDARFRDLFMDTLGSAGRGTLIDWPAARRFVERSAGWPGKTAHLYVSLAVLAKEHRISI